VGVAIVARVEVRRARARPLAARRPRRRAVARPDDLSSRAADAGQHAPAPARAHEPLAHALAQLAGAMP
jgi:hypothetical protein